ncbi:MAG: MerC domain-containing protein [Cyclobacteriaceae bacterium]
MKPNDTKADAFGILSSVLCILHCLLLPLMVLGGLVAEEWVAHSQWMDFLFIAFALAAVYFTTRQMPAGLLRSAMWVSVIWFGISVSLHHFTHLALYSSMLASFSLVVLHSINFRQHHTLSLEKKMA